MSVGAVGRRDGPLKNRSFPVLPCARLRGFSVIELMFTIVVIGLLVGVAFPSYRKIAERMKVTTCVADLRRIGLAIQAFQLSHNETLPASLDELAVPTRIDPWGFAYRYLDFSSAGAKKAIRKDHNLHPLNSAFDLYSVGPDGESRPPLTASVSRDDIVWARDGGFVGIAADF